MTVQLFPCFCAKRIPRVTSKELTVSLSKMFLSVFSFCIEVVCLTVLLPPLTLKSAKNIVTLLVYTGKERVLNADLQNIPQQAEADRGASIQSCKEYWISTREILSVGTGKCI